MDLLLYEINRHTYAVVTIYIIILLYYSDDVEKKKKRIYHCFIVFFSKHPRIEDYTIIV